MRWGMRDDNKGKEKKEEEVLHRMKKIGKKQNQSWGKGGGPKKTRPGEYGMAKSEEAGLSQRTEVQR
jgi:hypothetical protein